MNILHKLHLMPPETEWNDEFNDHIITTINFGVYSLNLNKSGTGKDVGLVISHIGSIKMPPPTKESFIPYQQIVDDSRILLDWIDSNVDIIAIQDANEAQMNDTVSQ